MLEQSVENYLRADCDQEAAEVAVQLAQGYETYILQKGKGTNAEMAKYYLLAGDCMEDFSDKACIECYEKAAYYQQSENNYQAAAKTWQTVAQVQQRLDHLSETITALDESARCFILQGSTTHAAKILEQKAQLLTNDGSYNESAMVFADIIQKQLTPFDNNILGFQSLLAMFTYTAVSQDESYVTQHDNLLCTIHPPFEKSYERRSLQKMIKAYLKNDPQAFTTAVSDYDTISSLSLWAVDLLGKIKSVMLGQFEGDDDILSPNTYELVQTRKSSDVRAYDPNDSQHQLYHRAEEVTPTYNEKLNELLN